MRRRLAGLWVLGVLAAVAGCEKAAPVVVRQVMTFEAWDKELAETVKAGITAPEFHRLLGDRWTDKQIFELGSSGSLCVIYLLEGRAILRMTCIPEGDVTSYGLAWAPTGKTKVAAGDLRLLSENDVLRVVRADAGPPFNPSQWYFILQRLTTTSLTEADMEGRLAGLYHDKQVVHLDGEPGKGAYRVVYLLRGGTVLDLRYTAEAMMAEYLIGPAQDEKATKLVAYAVWREFMRPDAKRPVVSYPPLVAEPEPVGNDQ